VARAGELQAGVYANSSIVLLPVRGVALLCGDGRVIDEVGRFGCSGSGLGGVCPSSASGSITVRWMTKKAYGEA